jgi:hypothetical protein
VFSAKGAALTASLGRRPRNKIEITTSAESANQSRGQAPVPRLITTTDIIEARLQRLLNAH